MVLTRVAALAALVLGLLGPFAGCSFPSVDYGTRGDTGGGGGAGGSGATCEVPMPCKAQAKNCSKQAASSRQACLGACERQKPACEAECEADADEALAECATTCRTCSEERDCSVSFEACAAAADL